MPFPSSGQISASTINSNLGNSSNTEIKFSNTLVSLAAGQFPAAQSAVDLKFSNFYFTQSLSNTALLFASDKSGNDSNEGTSSAMSADGRTLAVGMASDSTAGQFNGAAAVYFLTNNVWTQQGYNPSTGGPQNIITPAGVIGTQISFGSSVALSADGNTLAVGGPDDNSQIGAVWIFTRSSSIWTQQGSKLIGTGGDKARQGNSLALSADGNTLVVGGPNDRIGVNPNFTLVGATWVFTRSGSTWTQQGSKLVGTGSDGSSLQGTDVSLSYDGNTLAVGGQQDRGAQTGFNSTGATWVFTRSGSTWTQQGSKLVGTGWVGNEVRQGISVSLSSDGNTLAIGAFFDNGQVGATWIFTRSGSTWTQQGSKLVGTGATGSSWQGYDTELSSDGNVLLIGGPFDNSFAGAIWMFTRTGTTWTQIGSKVVNGAGTSFGNSLGLSKTGNTLGIGMPGYSRPFATAGGAELVYR
jgi:hypothetical protein